MQQRNCERGRECSLRVMKVAGGLGFNKGYDCTHRALGMVPLLLTPILSCIQLLPLQRDLSAFNHNTCKSISVITEFTQFESSQREFRSHPSTSTGNPRVRGSKVKGYQSSGSLLLASAVRTAACPVWPERDGGGTEQMRHAMAPKRINWI